jgi:hypothetical protein
MKFKAGLMYRTIRQSTSIGIFFIWWFVFGVILPLLGTFLASGDVHINTDGLISVMIFSLISAFMGVRTDFKYFIQMGVSRLNIFFINVGSILLVSLGLSIITFLASKISTSQFSINLPLLDKDIYNTHGFMSIFLIFMLIFFMGSLGLTFGTFNVMFQGVKKIVAMLIIMTIPTCLLIWLKLGGKVAEVKATDFFKKMVGYSNGNFSLTPMLTSLLIMSILVIGAFYLLNSRHQLSKGS